MMLKVGLTGNIGSGKSTVAMIFNKIGVPVFHADLEARSLFGEEKIKIKVREVFGQVAFHENGGVNRNALAAIVFADPEMLQRLNNIIHPAVRAVYNDWLSDFAAVPYTLYEAAVLFESGHYKEMDRIICVTAPEEIRIHRVMQRDGVTEKEIRNRMNNQWDESKKASKSDFIINNDGSIMLTEQVLAIHHQLIQH